MAKKIQTVLAVDIGGASLKMAEFSISPSGSVVLEKFAFCNFEDRDADQAESFAEAYGRLLEENDFTAKDVCLTISGQSSFCRLSKLPPLNGNLAAVSRIIGFEAQQIVPYPMDEVVWNYQLVSHIKTAEHTISEPGAEPFTEVEAEEEFEALFVAVKNEQVTMFTDTIVDSGKNIVSVDIAPLAMFNAAKAVQMDDSGSTLLLNIGGKATSLVISDGNRVFVRSIPIAGDTITQQISKKFGVSFAEAEDLKCRYGFVALGGAYEEPESEMAGTIAKIARNVMTRLHGEITRSINVWRSQHGGNKPGKMLLSGGGSMLYYTQEFFQEKLRMPVDFLNVFPLISLADGIDRQKLLDVAPMCSELIGAVIRCVTTCPVDISLMPKSIQFEKSFRRKAPYFYISGVLVLICLAFFFVAVRIRTDYSRNLVDGTGEEVAKTQSMRNTIRKLMRDNEKAKNDYNEAAAFIGQRDIWVDMLMDLQRNLPDHMWMVALEGRGEMSAGSSTQAEEKPAARSNRRSRRNRRQSNTPVQETAQVKTSAGRVDASRVTEVRELYLKLYSLVFDEELLEEQFRKALKGSAFFADDDDAFRIVAYESGKDVGNLKSFTVILKLKKPIRK